MSTFSRLTRLSAGLITLFTLTFFIYRIVFFVYFEPQQSLPQSDLWYAFYLGLKFDLRLATLLVLPLLSIGWIKIFHPYHFVWAKRFWLFYLSISFLILALIYFIDFGHYAYLKTHLDKTALRFLDNPTISGNMLWESYPIIWIGLFWLLLSLLMFFVVKKIFDKIQVQAEYQHKRLKTIVINTMVVILVFACLMAKISWYPLRWSDAYFSNNNFVADVVANPVLYSYDTLRFSDTNYDEEKTKQSFSLMQQYLQLPAKNSALDYTRQLQLTPQFVQTNNLKTVKPNVVFVFLESFAGYKTGLFGNPLNPSPNLDKLAKTGLFFENFYVPHSGTARSVFSTITGIPDTQLTDTATRNPLIVNQNTLINAFDGYGKLYFLGGSANWGNVRGVLGKNIEGLKIHEEGSYHSPSQDVWGISDADLFVEASAVLKKQKQPFVAIIQTSGNHRPYTIPEPNHGFKLLDFKAHEVKKYGFESLEELNSFRFLDHSVGVFIKQAKEQGFYDNTIFVFYADHGISAYQGEHQTELESKLRLGGFHVPLVIHAPKYLPAKVISTVASHTDILPMVAGILNQPYTIKAIGRNMLAAKYQNQQYAFTIEHGVVPTIGLIGKNYVYKQRVGEEKGKLYNLHQKEGVTEIGALHLKKRASMKALTEAIYQSSRYMLYHNKN